MLPTFTPARSNSRKMRNMRARLTYSSHCEKVVCCLLAIRCLPAFAPGFDKGIHCATSGSWPRVAHLVCGVKPVSLFLRVLEEAKRVWLPIKNTKAGEYRDRHEPPWEGEAEEKSRNTHGDKDGAPQAHEKRKLPSRQPAQTGCFSAKSDQHSAASPTGILGKRMSCITAHTIVKQLVSKVQSVNLIGTLSHEASQAFNG